MTTTSTAGNTLKGTRTSHAGTDISDLVSEENKLKKPYLRANADHSIHTLVHERKDVRKAVGLYNGIRDSREFAYLEDNYGIGNPAKLTFIPIIRKHIQVLLGQQATNPLNFKVTCSDLQTIVNIKRLQELGFVRDMRRQTLEGIRMAFDAIQTASTMPGNKAAEMVNEAAIRKLMNFYTEEWKSEFELTAQEVLQYHIYTQDLKINFMTFLEDLLVAGETAYRVYVEAIGTDPVFEVCSIENLFYRKNKNTRFLKNAGRIVYRKFMSRAEIINMYGHEMDQDQLEEISGRKRDGNQYASQNVTSGATIEHEWEGGTMTDGMSPEDVFPVYHCEWVANNSYLYDEEGHRVINPNDELLERAKGRKISRRYRLDLYECTRIGQNIYVREGKVKNVSRSVDKPWHCTLTYNGLTYSDRSGKPYSLVLATKDIQDKADILHMHLENTVARAGGKGLHVYAPSIPASFGDSIEERILVHQAYVKAGLNMIDDIQDGAKRDFNNYGTYDLSLDGKSVEAIIKMLQYLDDTASSITGVNRQTLGQIATEDGLGNTNIAMTQTALITKPYFVLVQELMKEAMTDLVNASRIAYSKGKKGTYLLGEQGRQIFTVDPTKFSASDYSVFISDSGVEIKDLEAIKALTMELVKGQMIKADVAVDMVTIKSLAGAKHLMKKALSGQEEEQLQQMQQKVQEMEQALQENQQQLQKFNELDMEIKKGNLDLAVQKFREEIALKRDEMDQKKVESEQSIIMDEKELALEKEQLLFESNARNNEVKNNK